MDFSVPDGTTIILYTGQSNRKNVWEIVENTSDLLGDSASFISNLPAGELLRNKAFKDALMDLVDKDVNTFNKITSGNDNGVRLEGGSSGYGDYLSLDDFVSKKIVSGSTNASNNLIFFCPEEVDMTKVLPITELPAALNNGTYEYINGIPKSMFVDLYESGNTDAIYQLLSRLSKEVVGDTKGIPEQASLLQRAIGEGGILSRTGEEFGLTLYFDELTGQLTAQLFSNSKGIPLLSDYAAGNCLLGETEIGTRYTKLAKGGRVFEIASDGQRVYLGRADIVTAEEAAANGYKAVKGLNGILAKVTPEGTIKFLCVAGETIGAVLIIKDAEEKFSDAWNKYRQGNYREGSKELISYGTALSASLVGSSLVASFAVAVGLAAGGPITIVASIVGCIIGYAIGQDIGDAIGDWVCDLLGYEDANYSNAGIAVRYDPLVIDLDGDGFELLSVKDGVYFDEDASGLMEKTAWVSAHDALLAIDLNGDGISQEDELYSLDDLGIESISLDTSEEDGRLTAKINYKDSS